MSKLHTDLLKNVTSAPTVHKTLNKSAQFLVDLCDSDKVPSISKINCEVVDYKPIVLGKPRDVLKDEICPESIYDPKAAKRFEERKKELEKKSFNKNIRVFGYKHPKSMKFMALLMRCLKSCIENKHEQLNLDMNSFLLLKNELSLVFLRN